MTRTRTAAQPLALLGAKGERRIRLFDLFWSVTGLIALSPLFLLIGITIKASDGGPIFYRQKRVGRYGRSFWILKFRTMSVGADGHGALLTVVSDTRITRLGHWLRKWKLDELPQLVNVVRGQMALVGPRPETPGFASHYTADQARILDLLPGITGAASIRYRWQDEILSRVQDPEAFYLEHMVPNKIHLNLEYAAQATVWSNFKLILATLGLLPPPAGVRQKGDLRGADPVAYGQPVLVTTAGRPPVTWTAVNLSPGGILLKHGLDHPPGTRLELTLFGGGPGQQVVSTEGCILRCDASGTAVRFAEIMKDSAFGALMTPPEPERPRMKIVYFASTDWNLWHFRRTLMARTAARWSAEVWCLCPDGPYRARLEAAGFHWVEVPLVRRISPFRDLAAFWRLLRLMRGLKPELVHNFTVKAVIYGGVAARLAGVPRIVNALVGLGSVFRGRSWQGRLVRLPVTCLLRAALRGGQGACIVQNPDDGAELAGAMGLEPGAIDLIRGSGVDLDEFQPGPEPPSPPVVLFVGRLLRDKGILDFCSAAAMVHDRFPEAQFVAIGAIDPGNPSSLTEAEVTQLSAQHPFLCFLGHREDMVAHYRACQMVVLPSTGEGVPRSLIEGAAMGRALVAYDVPGCREVVRHGHNGLLVPLHDRKALAAAMGELLADGPRRVAMGRAGRNLALRDFSIGQVLDQTFAVYQRLGLPCSAGADHLQAS